MVDTTGIVLRVLVYAADISENEGATWLLMNHRHAFPRLKRICVDSGYKAQFYAWVLEQTPWQVDILEKCQGQQGFAVIPKRRVVERTFAWRGTMVELLPTALRASLPTIQAVRDEENPMVHMKFFLPFTRWTWYAVAFDGVDTFIGWMIGDFAEVGSFARSELTSLEGPFGVKVERDGTFTPKKLDVVQAQERAEGRGCTNTTAPAR